MSRLALMIDMDRCIGCKSCEAACKQEHGLGPHEYRNKVLWLETPGTPAGRPADGDLPALRTAPPACGPVPSIRRPSPRTPRPASLRSTKRAARDAASASSPARTVPWGSIPSIITRSSAICVRTGANGGGHRPAPASARPHAIRFGERADHLVAVAREGRDAIEHDHFLMGPATVLPAAGAAAERTRGGAEADCADGGPVEPRRSSGPCTREGPYGADRDERTADRIVPGACNVCFNGCPVKFHIREDKVVGITGNDEDPIFRGRICPKSQMTLQLYNNQRRLTRPLKRVGPKGVGADGADCLGRRRWTKLPRSSSSCATGTGPEDVGPVLRDPFRDHHQQRLRAPVPADVGDTQPGEHRAVLLLHQEPWRSAWCRATGRCPTAIRPPTSASAGLFVYFGDNQAETRPVYFGMINEWRRRTGAGMVVIDPRLSATANAADRWLPIRSGTDMALVLAMINHIFARGLHDRRFCEHWMEGWERWRGLARHAGIHAPPGPLPSPTCRERRSKLSPKRSPPPTAACSTPAAGSTSIPTAPRPTAR